MARKRDNKQIDGQTIGKAAAAARQDCLTAALRLFCIHTYITHLHVSHVLCAMRMPSNGYNHCIPNCKVQT